MIIYEQGSRAASFARLRKRLGHIAGPRLLDAAHGPRRARNLWACERGKKRRTPRHHAKPYTLYMEVSSICQLQCPGCLSAEEGRHATLLPLDHFRALMARFAPWLIDLELYGWGEPFLNRAIFDMITDAKTRNLFVRTSTNCNAFKDDDPARIVDAGLDQLNCSLDGATQETYAAYRVGADLDRALTALSRIADAKRRAGALTPLVEWQMIVSKKNEHEVDAVKTLAEQAGVDILRLDLPFSLQHIDQVHNPEATAEWMADDPKYRLWADVHEDAAFAFDGPCHYLWNTLQVDATGQINPCPNRLGSQQQLGDPLKEDITELWNRPFFTQARGLFGKKPVRNRLRQHPCMGCREFRQGWKELA